MLALRTDTRLRYRYFRYVNMGVGYNLIKKNRPMMMTHQFKNNNLLYIYISVLQLGYLFTVSNQWVILMKITLFKHWMRLSQLSLLVRVTVDWFLACICSLWNFDASSLWERLSTASACIRVCTRKRSFENLNEGFSTHITHERFLCKAHHSCTLRLHKCMTDFTHGLPETKGFTCALVHLKLIFFVGMISHM